MDVWHFFDLTACRRRGDWLCFLQPSVQRYRINEVKAAANRAKASPPDLDVNGAKSLVYYLFILQSEI